MRIKKWMVEDFGKFHQQVLKSEPGINVITAPNESGKTTLRQFLLAMWYGLERERGLRARTDEYSRYKPWYFGRFQGAIEFEAEGKTYRLRRKFLSTEKEIELLCLDDGQKFERPEAFLRELGLVSESVYRNTFWIGHEARTEEVLAVKLKDHMANYTYTGGMELNLQRAKETLKKQKRELESRLPDKKLAECERQLQKIPALEQRLVYEREQVEEYRKTYENNEKNYQKMQTESERVYLNLQEIAKKQKMQQHGQWLLLLLCVSGILIGGACNWLFSFLKLEGGGVLLGIGLALCALGVGIGIPLIRKNRVLGGPEVEARAETLKRKIQGSHEEMKRFLPLLEKAKYAVELTEEQLKECEVFAAQKEELLQKKAVLEKEIQAVSLAEKTLEDISLELHKEYGEHFSKELSRYVGEFTDCAYHTLTADEGLNLRAITRDRSVEVTDVSHGTGEQFYLALRFAAADVFDEKKRLPIVLDDSFAAFDDQRLESAILALSKAGRQILLFSSTGREENALERMGIGYHKINLSE